MVEFWVRFPEWGVSPKKFLVNVESRCLPRSINTIKPSVKTSNGKVKALASKYRNKKVVDSSGTGLKR